MKNLFLFLFLFVSVEAFSEIKILSNRQKPAHQLKPHQNEWSVLGCSQKSDSVRKTEIKSKSSVQRNPTSQESDSSLKEELVGEDYYQTVDSRVIQQEVNRHLEAIEGLCNRKNLVEKIREWNQRSQALTELADRYVDERKLTVEDEYLLRSLRYYTSPGRLSYGQEITQELLNDIDLYEEFKTQYYADNRLDSDRPLTELPDEWANKIAKGLSCF